jgi:hypothetical protein
VSFFINSSIPGAKLGKGLPYRQAIPQLDGMYNWWRSAISETLVNTNQLSSWAGVVNPAQSITSAADNKRPLSLTNQINGWSGIKFDGVDDRMTIPINGSSTGVLASDYSLALVLEVRTIPTSGSKFILSGYTFDGVNWSGTLLELKVDGKLKFVHGDTYVETPIAINTNEPLIVILGLKNGFIRGRVNGMDMLSITGGRSAKSGLQTSNTNLELGAANYIGISAADIIVTDVIAFTRDVITDGQTSSYLEQYAALCYGAKLAYII